MNNIKKILNVILLCCCLFNLSISMHNKISKESYVSEINITDMPENVIQAILIECFKTITNQHDNVFQPFQGYKRFLYQISLVNKHFKVLIDLVLKEETYKNIVAQHFSYKELLLNSEDRNFQLKEILKSKLELEEQAARLIISGANINFDIDSLNRLSPLMRVIITGNFKNLVDLLIIYNKDLNFQDSKGLTALMHAVRLNKRDIVKKLIKNQADVNILNNKGKSALAIALSKFDVDVNIVRDLIKSGSNVNLYDFVKYLIIKHKEQSSIYPLYDMFTKKAELIIKNLPYFHYTDCNGNTPLIMAYLYGHTKIFKLLLLYGANIEVRNAYGQTVKDLAIAYNNRYILNMIESYYDIKERLVFIIKNSCIFDCWDRTNHFILSAVNFQNVYFNSKDLILLSMEIAKEVFSFDKIDLPKDMLNNYLKNIIMNTDIYNKAEEEAASLIIAGADPLICIDKNIVNYPNLINLVIEHIIVQNEIISPLENIDKIINLFKSNQYLSQHLRMKAEKIAKEYFASDLINLTPTELRNKVKDFNKNVTEEQIAKVIILGAFNKHLILFMIARTGRFENLIRLLAQYQIDLNCRNNLRKNALEIAIENNQITIVKELLKFGADPNSFNHRGGTLLMLAIIYKKNDIVRILLDFGANINYLYSSGTCALLSCVYAGYIDTLKFLIKRGANVELKDQYGNNCLMNILNNYDSSWLFDLELKETNQLKKDILICIVKVFLDNNINLNIKNNQNKTARDIALEKGLNEVIELIDDKTVGDFLY